MAPRLHCLLDIAQIVRVIDDEGADVNLQDVDGSTALHVARSSAVARTLIEYGADIECKNSRGMSPLHRVRNVGVARVLLKNGALVNATDNLGNTPLHLSNDVEVCKLLLKYSASVTQRNSKGETPIQKSHTIPKVFALFKAGADINAVDDMGRTLLMKKSRSFGSFYVSRFIEPLLSLKPCIRLKDCEGRTAIDFTIAELPRRRLLTYQAEEMWRDRRTLLCLRERAVCFTVKDAFMSRTVGLPTGMFRMVVCYL